MNAGFSSCEIRWFRCSECGSPGTICFLSSVADSSDLVQDISPSYQYSLPCVEVDAALSVWSQGHDELPLYLLLLFPKGYPLSSVDRQLYLQRVNKYIKKIRSDLVNMPLTQNQLL